MPNFNFGTAYNTSGQTMLSPEDRLLEAALNALVYGGYAAVTRANLRRMGADIVVSGRVAVVRGVEKLSGARVSAHDLRAGAALVLAGLCAQGETVVEHAERIDRGYERLEEQLGALGARVSKETDETV